MGLQRGQGEVCVQTGSLRDLVIFVTGWDGRQALLTHVLGNLSLEPGGSGPSETMHRVSTHVQFSESYLNPDLWTGKES